MAETPSVPSRPAKSPLLWIVVAFAVLMLVGLNVMSLKSTPKSDEEEAADKAAAAQQASPGASPTPAAAAADDEGADSLVTVGSAKLLGKVDSNKEVIVGFKWTPQVQGDPSKVYNAVHMLEQALPNVRIRVADVDQVHSLPQGISMGGHVVVPAEPDGSIQLPGPAVMAIRSAMQAPVGAMSPGALTKVEAKAAAGAAPAKH